MHGLVMGWPAASSCALRKARLRYSCNGNEKTIQQYNARAHRCATTAAPRQQCVGVGGPLPLARSIALPLYDMCLYDEFPRGMAGLWSCYMSVLRLLPERLSAGAHTWTQGRMLPTSVHGQYGNALVVKRDKLKPWLCARTSLRCM